MTVSQTVSDRKGGRRSEAGHGFDLTNSGHEVTDLSGQLGLGFGRVPCWVLAEGCGFGWFGIRGSEFDFDVLAFDSYGVVGDVLRRGGPRTLPVVTSKTALGRLILITDGRMLDTDPRIGGPLFQNHPIVYCE
jgi:hypothetical protein